MSIASINPTTGQQLKIFPTLADDVLRAKIIESERVFQDYRRHPGRSEVNGSIRLLASCGTIDSLGSGRNS